MARLVHHLPHRVVECDHGNSSPVAAGSFNRAANDIGGYHWANAIMDSDNINLIDVSHAVKRMLHAVPAGLTARHHAMRHAKAIPVA